jgi:hypothetical protein
MSTTPMPARSRLAQAVSVGALLVAVLVPVALLAAEDVESLGFDPIQLQQSLFGALRGWYGSTDVPKGARAAGGGAGRRSTLGSFAKSYYASAEFKKEYADAYQHSKAKGAAVHATAGNGKKVDTGALDKDPKKQLRHQLHAFLDATEGVDYAAATHADGGLKMFDKSEYEAKPREWKMCYRAGKETGEAVRAFARDWLTQLK